MVNVAKVKLLTFSKVYASARKSQQRNRKIVLTRLKLKKCVNL